MADPLLPPDEPAAVRRGPVTCGFCNCKLTADGEIVKLSAESKGYRDQEDKIAALLSDADTLTRERDAANERAAAAERALDELKRSKSYQPMFGKG